jgi:peptide/nickel transport system substrate-binding protein
VLESYTAGESLVLVRNENFWGTPATFPKVTIKQVKDSTAQLQQLQAGDVDIAMQISIDAVSQLEGDPNLIVKTVDSYNYVYVAFSPGAVGAEGIADDNVRKAMKLALDYDGIIDVTVAGAGKKQASPIPNGFIGSADLALPEQNLDEAKKLMADAGYADGFTVMAMYPTVNVYGVDFDTMMQKVQQDLKAINVNLELKPVEFPQWIDQINAEGIPVTAVYFAPDHTDSSQYVQYFGEIVGSPWANRAGGGDSGTPLSNPLEDELLAKALAASGDAKTEFYTQLGQAMMDDGVIVPLVNPQLVQAYAKDITNMHNSACCNLELGLLGLG